MLPETDEVARLRRERDQAIAHARCLEHELGELRGQVKRFELMLWRRVSRRERWIGRARRVRGLLERAVRR